MSTITSEVATDRIKKGKESWPVEHIQKSRLEEVDLNNLAFGRDFSDHMLIARYLNGAWREVNIKPFGNLSLSPASLALHYGQSIFEGIKAYKNKDGQIGIFRPEKNFERFLKSAARMAMPPVPYEIFIEGIWQLVQLDKDWIPDKEGSSLYIRPLLFASDGMLGVKAGSEYIFLVITSPSGPYYNKPLKLYVEDYYVRAAEGGVGAAKTAGNYAASLLPTQKAVNKGCDQILWTDAKEHKYLQECGTMNLFVVIDGVAITASLKKDSILAGITRDSVIDILRERKIPVEEREISIDEVVAAHKRGTLEEVFGTGTAANIIFVQELLYGKQNIKLTPHDQWKLAPSLLKELNEIHYGLIEDHRNWMWRG